MGRGERMGWVSGRMRAAFVNSWRLSVTGSKAAVSVVNVLVTTAWESCYVCLRMCSQLLQVGELTELQNAGLYVGLLI